MNLRNHLIRLAHAKPELRPLLLPLLKEGRGSAAPALKQEPASKPAPSPDTGGGAKPPSGGGDSDSGKVIKGPWGDKPKGDTKKEDKPKAEGDSKPKSKSRNDLGATPEAAKKMFEKYKADHPDTTKTEKDFLDPNAKPQEDAAKQEEADAEKAKPQPGSGQGGEDYHPKKTEVGQAKKKTREQHGKATVTSLNKKYDSERDEEGNLSEESKAEMDAEYSEAMRNYDQQEKRDKEDKAKQDREELTSGHKKQDAEARKKHEDAALKKLQEEHGDDKAAIGRGLEKEMAKYDKDKKTESMSTQERQKQEQADHRADYEKSLEGKGYSAEKIKNKMDKYDEHFKKKQKRKDDGAVKTMMDSYKKWKNLTKTWLNPESNPIVNEFKQASRLRAETIYLANSNPELRPHLLPLLASLDWSKGYQPEDPETQDEMAEYRKIVESFDRDLKRLGFKFDTKAASRVPGLKSWKWQGTEEDSLVVYVASRQFSPQSVPGPSARVHHIVSVREMKHDFQVMSKWELKPRTMSGLQKSVREAIPEIKAWQEDVVRLGGS